MTINEKLIEVCNNNLETYIEDLKRLREIITIIEEHKKNLTSNEKTKLSLLEDYEKLYNYYGYVCIGLLDLSVNLKNLLTAKTDWERAFFIKNAYLIIIETSKKIKPFDNKKSFIQNIIENEYFELNEMMVMANRKIDDFRTTNSYKFIKSIRDNIAAHIDVNFKTYFDNFKKLDAETAADLIYDYLEILRETIKLISELNLLHNKEFTINNLNNE